MKKTVSRSTNARLKKKPPGTTERTDCVSRSKRFNLDASYASGEGRLVGGLRA
jgi:hypothetical protein